MPEPLLAATYAALHDGAQGTRLCLWHTPRATPPRALVVFIHPFAEEMNKSRRMAALQSRALAASGCAVLQFDLLGCGDSSGDFGDATWAAWADDVVAACQWARLQHRLAWPDHPPPPLWLWGLRTGCLLAAAAAARMAEPCNLLFWQASPLGKTALQQFLRLDSAAALLGKPGAQGAASTRDRLGAGEAVDIAGYRLNPALASGLGAARLLPPPQPARLEWIDVGPQAGADPTPAASTALQAWRLAGFSVKHHTVAGPSFWQTTEVELAPELLRATGLALHDGRAAAAEAGATLAHRAAHPTEPAPQQSAQLSAPLLAPLLAHTALGCTEVAIGFDCAGARLLGIVAAPAAGRPASGTAVVVVVGGPQYRAGAHRQFVQLARALAGAGHAVLRFDARGMGDSDSGDIDGEPRDFEHLTPDIAAAIDALLAHAPQTQRLVLYGLCDGASAALLYLHDTRDPRVHGLCLLNPWVRTDESLARTHVRHYYLQRLGSAEFWRKLLRGGVAARALRDFAGALRRSLKAPAAGGGIRTAGRQGLHFRDAMRTGLATFGGPVLLALSGNDLTAQEFADTASADPQWRAVLARSGVRRVTLEQADHTLSSAAAQTAFESALQAWLAGMALPAAASSEIHV
jgi:exosortase A-associated hydrolase 1/exosortase A-associated hydrolase 2